jgi:hypothetical protein
MLEHLLIPECRREGGRGSQFEIEIQFGVFGPHDYDAFRGGYAWRVQENLIDQAEYRGIPADADGHDGDGKRGETGIAAEIASGVAEVAG